jgi:hypothetical protein
MGRVPHPLDALLRPVVRDPRSWFGCARELSELLPSLGEEMAGEVGALNRDHSHVPRRLMALGRAFQLLAGYAVENYLKGLWITRSGGAAASEAALATEPFLPSGMPDHNLARLAREAGVALDPRQNRSLELLERSITWYARYPVPKQPEDFSLFGPGSNEIAPALALIAHLEGLAAAIHVADLV